MEEFYETTFSLANKKNADLEAVLFGKEDCAPSHSYGPTLRPYHLFHFVTKGNGVLRIDGRQFELSAGDAFLIPAEQLSYYEASAPDPWSYCWAGFTGIRADAYVQQILEAVPERYVLRGLETQKYDGAIGAIARAQDAGTVTAAPEKACKKNNETAARRAQSPGAAVFLWPGKAARGRFWVRPQPLTAPAVTPSTM